MTNIATLNASNKNTNNCGKKKKKKKQKKKKKKITDYSDRTFQSAGRAVTRCLKPTSTPSAQTITLYRVSTEANTKSPFLFFLSKHVSSPFGRITENAAVWRLVDKHETDFGTQTRRTLSVCLHNGKGEQLPTARGGGTASVGWKMKCAWGPGEAGKTFVSKCQPGGRRV